MFTNGLNATKCLYFLPTQKTWNPLWGILFYMSQTPSCWLYISYIYLQKLYVFLIISYCNQIKLWQIWYHKVFITVEKTWISVQCIIWKYKFLPYSLFNWLHHVGYTAEILKNKVECNWCWHYDILLQWGSVKLCSEFFTRMDLGRRVRHSWYELRPAQCMSLHHSGIVWITHCAVQIFRQDDLM